MLCEFVSLLPSPYSMSSAHWLAAFRVRYVLVTRLIGQWSIDDGDGGHSVFLVSVPFDPLHFSCSNSRWAGGVQLCDHVCHNFDPTAVQNLLEM